MKLKHVQLCTPGNQKPMEAIQQSNWHVLE